MKDKLKVLIQEQIKQSFTAEYQSQVKDEEALGIMLSQYFEWDGLALLRVTYAALEDANFHKENKTIQAMIDKIEENSK